MYQHNSLPTQIQITRREREVLQLIANGYSSKEIAHKLFISTHTATNHRKNLITKFDAKNTAHLIKIAFVEQKSTYSLEH